MGFDPLWFGCDGLDGILTGVENWDTTLAEGVMLLTPFAADAKDDLTQNFVRKYVDAYKETPNQFAADAYDAVYAIKEAAEAANLKPDMSISDMCEAMKTAMTTISIDGFRGKVTEIGIRTTKLLDAAGNIKIINHSNIVNVVNLSRELSLAVVDCDFPYDIPIEHIEGLFEKKFPIIAEKIPAIVEGPYYKGVTEYKDSNVTVKIVAKCHEDDRFQVQRDLMREYRAILVEEGIDISYPQIVINQPEPKKNITVSKKKKQEAYDFVEEQKDLSSDLEEQHN